MTFKRLATRPVTTLRETAVTGFADRMATILTHEGEQQIGPFDTVVAAGGTRPNRALLEPLTGLGLDVRVVGDAHELGQVMGAVRSGWQLAREL